MAAGNIHKILLNLISVTFLLVIIQKKTEATTRKSSGLLSLLTSKLHHHDQPVIIILGEDADLKKDRSHVDEGTGLETSVEDRTARLVHHLLGHDQLKTKTTQLKRNTVKPYQRDEKKRQHFRVQREREERVLQKEDRNALRSPIVKKLLRISNSLRCEAKDECQDKCSNKFNRKTVTKCLVQCETKYECEEEGEDDKDPCIDDNCDSCNQSGECGKTMSTKGERFVTNEPECKRC